MDSARAGEPWLPDLCRLPRLAMMFGVAELVVLVLALAPDGTTVTNLAANENVQVDLPSEGETPEIGRASCRERV